MMVDISFVVFAGIVAGLLIMIAVHWFLAKNDKQGLQNQGVNTWEEENERWLKKKRIKEYAKTISKNPIKPFRPKPFKVSKEKFEDLPTIQCRTCGQLFRCNWNDPQLVIHEEQELSINKDWKGFEKVGKTS